MLFYVLMRTLLYLIHVLFKIEQILYCDLIIIVCKSSMYEILYCDLIIMVCKSSMYEFNINYVL